MTTTQTGSMDQSPRSPSSRAQYLTVSVSDPAKMGNGVQASLHLIQSYYQEIDFRTNLPEYEGPDKIVIRRYSDFVWLRERLFEKFKGIFVPPLPEKSTVEKFRFTAEFIEMKRQALDVFGNRIASHHELQQSEDLRTFLLADEQLGRWNYVDGRWLSATPRVAVACSFIVIWFSSEKGEGMPPTGNTFLEARIAGRS